MGLVGILFIALVLWVLFALLKVVAGMVFWVVGGALAVAALVAVARAIKRADEGR